MRKVVLIIALGIVTALNANVKNSEEDQGVSPRQSSLWWVFFTDKGPNVMERVEQIKQEWNSKSRHRRLKNGEDVSVDDLPVWREYIEAVQSAGATIRRESRWFNALSIEATQEVVRTISDMPFVGEIAVVKKMIPQWIRGWEDEPLSGSNSPTPGDYGSSYRQAELCQIPQLHQQGYWGQGVLIGLLDTGFSLEHTAFSHLHLGGAYDFIFNDPYLGFDASQDPPGQADHGTVCLSVLAGYAPGRLIGVAPLATYLLAKTEMTKSEEEVEEDWWITALEWMENLGVDVVSSSLTYKKWYQPEELEGRTPLISRAAERAYRLGVIVVNAAGNEGPELSTLGAPADSPEVLTIGATDSAGNVTRFSSRGPTADGRIKPDLVAMGEKVACVNPRSVNRYARWSGTSLATPIIAGICALLIQAHPHKPSRDIIAALKATATHNYHPNPLTGYGIPNALEALQWLNSLKSD